MRFLLSLAALLLLVHREPARARDGDIDGTFGSGGVAQAHLDDARIYPKASVVSADGAVFVASLMESMSSGERLIAISKFTAAGVPDASFSFDGNVVTDFGGDNNDNELGDLLIQPDGKLVVIGSSRFGSSAFTDFAIERLNADGSIDTSFGQGTGRVHIAFDAGAATSDLAIAGAFLPNGGIAVAGSCAQDFCVAALNANGTLNIAFNGSGKKLVSFDGVGGHQDAARAIAADTNGNLFVAGMIVDDAAETIDIGVAKLTSSGALDSSFSTDGRLVIAFDPANSDVQDDASGVILQGDRIIVSGTMNRIGLNGAFLGSEYAAVALRPDGSVDNSFGGVGTGRAIVGFDLTGSSSLDVSTGLALQSDKKLLIAGYAQDTATSTAAGVVRLNPDGTLDASFGVAGFPGRVHYSIDFGSVSLQGGVRPSFQAGKPVVAIGPAAEGVASEGSIAVVRLLNDLIFAGDFQ